MSAIKRESQPTQTHTTTRTHLTSTAQPPVSVEDLTNAFAGVSLVNGDNSPIEVFIHGSAPRNGQPDVTGAYACVFPGYPNRGEVHIVDPECRTTGPRTSLLAATLAIEIANTKIDPSLRRPLHIISNDKNLKVSMTNWIAKWKKKQWKRSDNDEVANRDLIEAIDSNPRKTIKWFYSEKDFRGEHDNEQKRVKMYHDLAVEIAREAASKP